VAFLLGFPFSLFMGDTVGYLFSFFPIYILARILFKYMRPWLPYFRGVQRMLDAAGSV
jgi:predicted MFS family arabinose efflux permease